MGVYSREILRALAGLHPGQRFLWYYRPHRVWRALQERLPENCSRRILWDAWVPSGCLFHGLNQRMPKRVPRRSVVTFHDLFVLTGDYSTPEFRRRFAAQAREAALRADLIICVSQFTAGQVRDLLHVDPSRLRVVWHGVHPVRELGTVARDPVVLHVGALQKRKNINRLVDAFEQMSSDWTLVLAGAYGYGAEEILSHIRQSRARNRIRLLGYVDDQRLQKLYQTAGMLVFPSLDEGFGIPVLEAMAHGLPVITSNGSALREVGEGAALLVDPENTDEIAGAMRRLAEDEGLRRDLVRKGLSRAAAHSWVEAASQTWRVYEQLWN
ncbi:MAG: glycosyltransferase family 4 protein [Bryobacteraceae bacterium]|nr:glycosyltransferase family 4 protein [Bryobacteraceae bacterium]MDW8379645.1 glycosyltransferase family 1 protein [Bryobacterales bacterium]